MVIGIRPTVDFEFKLMFGSPDHLSVTIHFLNAVLGQRDNFHLLPSGFVAKRVFSFGKR